MRSSDVWIVVPAYNESEVLESVLNRIIEEFGNNIVLVDDCSSDNTAWVARQLNIDVISHPINLGQGAALQTGIERALRLGAKAIVTMDSDGQHRVEDAKSMVKKLNLNSSEVICGSRFLGVEPVNMPRSKWITLRLATIFTKMLTGVPVTDAHNGLRALTRSAAMKIHITQNRMAHATEIIKLFKKNNIKYSEFPVQIIYSEYSIRKGQKITNSLNILMDLLLGGISK